MGRILDFHKRNCFAILVQSFFILAFIGGYIAFLTTFLNQNRDQTQAAEFFPNHAYDPADLVVLSVSVITISPVDYNCKVTVDIESVPDSWIGSDNTLNRTFTIGIGREEVVVKPSGNFKPITTTIPLIKGAFDMYPFDHYDSEIAVYVYTGPTYSNSSTELALIVNKAISYGFTFSVGDQPTFQDIGATDFMINITRTDVFRLYPVFMIIAFWLVGGFFSLMASLLVIWNRAKVEAPMLGASISLIFALPVFRNTAPQSPPIGCTLDVCSFYWAMLFVIIGVIGLILRYLIQAPAPPAGGDIQHLLFSKAVAANRKLRGIEDHPDDVPMKDM
ncbi:uncharacterized protein ACA1_116690 [Acanthamoeba castellanii str. Neff]|uniref:Transmembrane protein n=1 Tax=Acanthamoeba castellanii (strain ATCC 30010 / Neff) TaxID=1257118 RepID=L8H4Q7_ACACF|nr:uncharacterized protein ACA1_116690 [Acanthamoeba castellanii str. Neff]ELR20197.1 hypothetical protein ACA1_116690 [Acanthamoeba castellanii str. Neff]